MAAPDLRTFSRVLEALYSEALKCLADTESDVMDKAWRKVAGHLSDAILAADTETAHCEVCGTQGPLTPCRWCALTACAGECLHDMHGGRECPHAPHREQGYDGEPEPDISFSEKKEDRP